MIECVAPRTAKEFKTNFSNCYGLCSIHSVIIDKAPTRATHKAEVVQWLQSHKVLVDPSMNKCELLHLVQQRKPVPTYATDQLAEKNGHRVLCLPPYH